ncbi:MAG: protein kinase [Pirellulaceae bacterium]
MLTNNCPNREQIEAYLLGTLDESLADSVTEHSHHCLKCQPRFQELETVSDRITEYLRSTQFNSPERLTLSPHIQRVLEKLFTSPPNRSGRLSLNAFARNEPLGPYRLQDQLGRGGMGTVYRAVHQRLDKPVAIKVIECHGQQDRHIADRFEREMLAIGRLEHVHLIKAFDAGDIENGRFFFLAMELLEGLNGGELVDRLGVLPIADVCEILRQVALGLEYIHQQGMTHRDMKPSNIMLTHSQDSEGNPQAIVKVLDLGLARFHDLGDELTTPGQVMGTLDYIPPEQIGNTEDVGPASDLYSLGCTAYKLLTGQAPFADKVKSHPVLKLQAHQQTIPQPIRKIRPDVPAELEALIARLLAKRPADRIPRASSVAQILKPLAEGSNLNQLLIQAENMVESTASITADVDRNSDLAARHVAAYEPTTSSDAVIPLGDYAKPTPEPKPKPSPTPQTVSKLRLPQFFGNKVALACVGFLFAGLVGAQIVVIIRDKDGNESEYSLPEDKQLQVAGNDPTPVITSNPQPLPTGKYSEPISSDAIVNKPAVIADVESWTLETIASRDGITCAEFRPDGKQLATTGPDGTVRLWNSQTGELERALITSGSPHHRSLAYSADGTRLASTGNAIQVWAADSGNLLMSTQLINDHGNPIAKNAALSPDGRLLVTCYQDVQLWDVDAGRQLDRLQPSGESTANAIARFSPDGVKLAIFKGSNSGDCRIEVWDAKRRVRLLGEAVKFDRVPGESFRPQLAWSPSGKLLAVSDSIHAQLYDSESLKPQLSVRCQHQGRSGLAWSADGTQIAIGHDWFNAQSGERVESAPADDDHPLTLARSQTPQILELLLNTAEPRRQEAAMIRDGQSGAMIARVAAEAPGGGPFPICG